MTTRPTVSPLLEMELRAFVRSNPQLDHVQIGRAFGVGKLVAKRIMEEIHGGTQPTEPPVQESSVESDTLPSWPPLPKFGLD